MTGRASWLAKTKTPKQVASGFVFSQEMANRNLSNQEYVTMLYRTMMDREPDEAGLNDWVTRLQSGTSARAYLTVLPTVQSLTTLYVHTD